MYAGSKLVGPELSGYDIFHIIIAGALASAGSSALNHFYDRDIDSKMERTSKRPIPSGRTHSRTVLVYGLGVSIVSVVYAAFTLNYVCTFFIALGIFFYVIIYTVWLKRRNSSNIVIGGFAGSKCTNVTSIDRYGKNIKIHSCKYHNIDSILIDVIRIWYGSYLYHNCCSCGRFDVIVSLQVNTNSNIRFCVESIQGHCPLSHNNLYRNCTGCSFSL